jgi:hypothetical protein
VHQVARSKHGCSLCFLGVDGSAEEGARRAALLRAAALGAHTRVAFCNAMAPFESWGLEASSLELRG